jgi:heptosyltransferase-1
VKESSTQRILIVKLGAIGDVVNSLPFLNRLRAGRPGAHITWAIAPLAHALVRGHGAVDEFLILDTTTLGGQVSFLRELMRRRFDLAIDLQRLTKSSLIARLSGAPERLGFDRARCKEISAWFTNRKIPPNPEPGTTLDQYIEFADVLGLPPSPMTWDLPVEEAPATEETGSGPRLVVSMGASKEANRWPAAHWSRLCAGLVERFDARLHLSGGPEDRPLAEEVARAAGVPLANRTGQLSLKQTGGLIAGADLFIGGDTGPLHMAVGLRTPVVALFGASDPARTGPWRQAEGVVQGPPPAEGCAPCRKRHCFVAGHPCMADLAPEAVLARAGERLGAGAGR